MSKQIDPDRTGPGICKECGRRAKRRLKGWCRPCYDRLRRDNDPFVREAIQQKAIDRAPARLVQIQSLIKRLWEDGMVTTDTYAIIHELSQDSYDQLRSMTASDLRQQYQDAMAKLELESRNTQPQPDQAGLDLQNIPDNPNPVEVEEIPSQPQPDSTGQAGAPSVATGESY
jgi:hypothetical protein